LFSFVLHSFRTKKEGKFCHLFNKKLEALCFFTIAGLVVGTLVSVWLIWSVIAVALWDGHSLLLRMQRHFAHQCMALCQWLLRCEHGLVQVWHTLL
jgi:hypothetical protein